MYTNVAVAEGTHAIKSRARGGEGMEIVKTLYAPERRTVYGRGGVGYDIIIR